MSLRHLVAALALATTSVASAQPISAVLHLRERVLIETLAHNVTDPTSARFGQFYSPEEIRDLAGPSDVDYRALITQLQSEGFRVTNESPTHLWIGVSADHTAFEQAFGSRFEFLGNGRHRHVATARLAFRYSLIQSVGGLDSVRVLHPRYLKQTAAQAHTFDAGGGIPQATIKTAYGFDPIYAAGVTGKGQHIAIATYDGFNVSDVQKFYKDSSLTPGPTVDVVSFNGTAAYQEDSAVETQLDAEFSGMMAPGAAVHVFASAANSDAGELQMFTAILDDNRAKVANYSWGSCERDLTPAHKTEMTKVFARATAQGVNVMVASGDSGSDSCQDGTKIADWPAANDNVVAVGGTTFAQRGADLAETGWSGSGGGISAVWSLPTWQAKLGGIFVKRSYPDVSFNADPSSGQAVWAHQSGRPQWIVIGGTSMSAPQWSGFMALVGEARANKGLGPVGYLNPILYSLSDAERAPLMHDVTSGNNGAYNAGPGWDAVTGFGSMQADALLTRLTQ